MKLTDPIPIPKWMRRGARVITIIVVIAFVGYSTLYTYPERSLKMGLSICIAESTGYGGGSTSALAQTKEALKCAEADADKSLLGGFAYAEERKLIKTLPSTPCQFVGVWLSARATARYKITLNSDGEFTGLNAESPPGAAPTEIGSWGVVDDKMIWLYQERFIWPPDINHVTDANVNSFTLTEVNGTKTQFVRAQGAVVTECGQPITSTKAAAPKQAIVDTGTRLNVWELRNDIDTLQDMPHAAMLNCWPSNAEQGSGKSDTNEAAVNAALKACGVSADTQNKAYFTAKMALNKKWRPLLFDAMQKRDMVAELILRNCGTTDVIDRRGLETDCSSDPTDVEIARTRLMLSPFVVGMESSNRRTVQELMAKAKKSTPEELIEMRILAGDPAVVAMQTILEAVDEGDLGAADSMEYVCNLKHGEDSYQRCNYLYHLIYAICGKAEIFFTAGLATNDNNYANIAKLSLYRPQTVSPMPYRVVNDTRYPDNLSGYKIRDEAGFKQDLAAHLAHIKLSVSQRVLVETRLGVFLLEREGNTIRNAKPH